jgi:UPF0755 protein
MAEARERTAAEREAAAAQRAARRQEALAGRGLRQPPDSAGAADRAGRPRTGRAARLGTGRTARPGTGRSLGTGRTRRPAARRGLVTPARFAAGAALLLALAVAWFLVELFQPFYGRGRGHVEVTIPRGASAARIGDLLVRDGVIGSSFFFSLRAALAGDGGHFYAGTYRLARGMSYGQVLAILTAAPPAAPSIQVTLIPGQTRAQVAAILRREHLGDNYLALTRRSPLLKPTSYGAPASTPNLEGFLFPDTYRLTLPVRLSALVDDQLETFKREFATVNMSYARAHGLTPYDVLIIASMVEGEAATEHDRLAVASVIYNRLRLGMPLQIDATTRYATGNYTRPLTQAQLNSPSPYNTRIHRGLPPTPIDSPSLASIQAAAHPPRTDYLYFVVKPCGNGAMAFTSSYSQFLADQAAYYAARAARGGRSPEFCRSR